MPILISNKRREKALQLPAPLTPAPIPIMTIARSPSRTKVRRNGKTRTGRKSDLALVEREEIDSFALASEELRLAFPFLSRGHS
ncbi:hypothetical protein V6N12_076027 [Hibiscus sabdariffa]